MSENSEIKIKKGTFLSVSNQMAYGYLAGMQLKN